MQPPARSLKRYIFPTGLHRLGVWSHSYCVYAARMEYLVEGNTVDLRTLGITERTTIFFGLIEQLLECEQQYYP